MLQMTLGICFLLAAMADNCEDPVAASWIQMKLHYQLTQRSEGYYWSKRGADTSMSSAINWTVPDISGTPSWIWPNGGDEQVRHSPLIDEDLSIYLATTTQIRKFDHLGNILWTWQQDEKMVTSPVLYQGKIYCLSGCGTGKMLIYAIHMKNGTVDWNVTMVGNCNLEANAMLAVNDTLVMPLAHEYGDLAGANGLRAVSTNGGDHLWDFLTDEVFWNFAPSVVDESLIFSSTCGMAFRISLETGELQWKAGHRPPGPTIFCSTGGGAMGPNGIFYAESSPAWMFFASHGQITAFNASNGEIVWQKDLEAGYGGNQYPSVGYMGPSKKLAVVVGVGENTLPPRRFEGELLHTYLTDAEFRATLKVPHWKNRVMALDASTGETLWQYEEPVWDHFGAAGDEEKVVERTAKNSIEGSMCLPDPQGIPVLNQLDGTVFFSSSHSGNLTAINDANGNGIIEPSEVQHFAPHIAFLNSPSMAPGMLVAAPCWGPTYVFKQ